MQMRKLRLILLLEIVATLSGLLYALDMYLKGYRGVILGAGAFVLATLLITGAFFLWSSIYRAKEEDGGVICFDPRSIVGKFHDRPDKKQKLCWVHFGLELMVLFLSFVLLLVIGFLSEALKFPRWLATLEKNEWLMLLGTLTFFSVTVVVFKRISKHKVAQTIGDIIDNILDSIVVKIFGILILILIGLAFFVLLWAGVVEAPIQELNQVYGVNQETASWWYALAVLFVFVAIGATILVVAKEQWFRRQWWMRPFWLVKDQTCVDLKVCEKPRAN